MDADEIGAIGITIQRETFVCLDEHNRPIRPAILWLDSRAGPQVAKSGSDKVHEITGKPPNPTPGFYKMLWLRENEPGTLDRRAKVVDVHAYLVHRMTNQWKTSWATADPLGLVDMRTFDWSDELLGMVGLTREHMAEINPPGEILGELADEVAAEVGIPAGIPVVAGSGDGQSAGLGANITRAGRAYPEPGHGSRVRLLQRAVPPQPRLPGVVRPDPAHLYLRAAPAGRDVHRQLVRGQVRRHRRRPAGPRAVGRAAPGGCRCPHRSGRGGLFAVPYWSTAATPYWDAQAQGVMLGWNGSHTKAHAYRAILEGIAFEVRLMTDGVEAGLEQPIERFYAMGGGSRSPLWCQIVADVTNREVVVCKEVETTALGAAMQAAAAAGNFGDIRAAADAMSGEGATYSPDEATAARYDRLYTDVYKEIYPRVAPVFKALDALRDIAISMGHGSSACRAGGHPAWVEEHGRATPPADRHEGTSPGKVEAMAVVTILGAGAMGGALTTPALTAGRGAPVGHLAGRRHPGRPAGRPPAPRINMRIDPAARLFDSADLGPALDGSDLVILAISSVGWSRCSAGRWPPSPSRHAAAAPDHQRIRV